MNLLAPQAIFAGNGARLENPFNVYCDFRILLYGIYFLECKVKTLWNAFFHGLTVRNQFGHSRAGRFYLDLGDPFSEGCMYPWLECFLLTALVVGIGTGVFLAAAMAIILKAGWSVAATHSRPLTAKARAQLREKLNALHLVEAAGRRMECEP